MRFGFSTNAFREYGLAEAIEVIADAGYDGVEVLLDSPHLYPHAADAEAVAQVRGTIADCGLEVSNCNAFMLTAIEDFHHPSFVEVDPDYRRQRVEYTKAALETAAELGGEHISIEPGGPIPEEKSREWATDTFVEGLSEVLDHAAETGVDVLVEPEPDLLIESSDGFLELVDRVDHPRLGCNFDAGHFFCVGEDPVELVDELAEYTAHYHLEDIPADRTHEHTQLGDGAMDLDGFLEAVEESGYDGFVTVELYPYQETAVETARGAMDWLESHGWT